MGGDAAAGLRLVDARWQAVGAQFKCKPGVTARLVRLCHFAWAAGWNRRSTSSRSTSSNFPCVGRQQVSLPSLTRR